MKKSFVFFMCVFFAVMMTGCDRPDSGANNGCGGQTDTDTDTDPGSDCKAMVSVDWWSKPEAEPPSGPYGEPPSGPYEVVLVAGSRFQYPHHLPPGGRDQNAHRGLGQRRLR